MRHLTRVIGLFAACFIAATYETPLLGFNPTPILPSSDRSVPSPSIECLSRDTGLEKKASCGIDSLDIVIIHQKYDYRRFAALYDSINPMCGYGEIFVTNGDSLQVGFVGHYEHGFDTLANDLPGLTRSAPFYADQSTTMSLFRVLGYMVADRAVPPHFPDTCQWVLHLRNAESKEWLATLDSVGFKKQLLADTSHFPAFFGTLDPQYGSYGILEYSLGDYVSEPSSVYLEWHVEARGNPSLPWNCIDSYIINKKYSSQLLDGGIGRPATRAGSSKTISSAYQIGVFPSPVSWNSRIQLRLPSSKEITLRIYTMDGKQIASLYQGLKHAGLHVMGVRWPRMSPGVYMLVVEDPKGAKLVSQSFVKD